MKYVMKAQIIDLLEAFLFEIDIPSSEVQNVTDAFHCELRYNNLDVPVGEIQWSKSS